MSLPICDLTDLPRLLCGCQIHGETGFTMTATEIDYLNGATGRTPTFRQRYRPAAIPEYASQPWTESANVKVTDSNNPCQIRGCTRPAGDAFVCNPHIDDLEVALGDTPALAEDLMMLLTGQQRFSSNGGGGGKDRSPLPYSPAASKMMTALQVGLTAAARTIADHLNLTLPPTITEAVTCSRWLLNHTHTIALHPDGPNMVDEIVSLTAHARRLIDRPAGRTYIGLCNHCHTAMHADGDQTSYRCNTCLTEYDVQLRRAELSERVRTANLTLMEMARLSRQHLGGPITVKQLEGLVRRRRLTDVGSRVEDGKEVRLYPASEVLRIMEERKRDRQDNHEESA